MKLVLFFPYIVTAITHIHHHLYVTHCLLLHVSAIGVIRILLSHWCDVVLSCNLWMLLTNLLLPFAVWSCLPTLAFLCDTLTCRPVTLCHVSKPCHIMSTTLAMSSLASHFFSEQFMVTVFRLPEKVMTSLYRRVLWNWSSVSLVMWSAAN